MVGSMRLRSSKTNSGMQNRMSVAFLSQTTSETAMAGSELVCGIQSRRDEVMAKESFCGDFGGFRIGLNQRTSMGCLYPHGSAGTASGQGLSPFPLRPTIRPAPFIGVAVSQRAHGALSYGPTCDIGTHIICFIALRLSRSLYSRALWTHSAIEWLIFL